MKNERGAIAIAAIGLYVLIGIASVALVLLTPLKNAITIPGEGKQTVQTQSYKETIEPYTENGQPVKVKLADGSEGLVFKRTTVNNSLDEQTQPKLTLWQKIKQLGLWWIILTVAGMFFAPLGLIMNTINGKAKKAALALADKIQSKHDDLQTEAKRIVLSVDKGLDSFDVSINAANAMLDSATKAAATITDPTILATHQSMINTYQAVAKSLVDTKSEFLKSLKEQQDESTKLLVSSLRHQ